MKKIVGCLSVIGIIAILSVVGCVTLIGYTISSLPEIPKYATLEYLNGKHGNDVKIIKEKLSNGKEKDMGKSVSDHVIAIFNEKDDILRRNPLSGKSHLICNDIGVGILSADGNKTQCIACRISCLNKEYVIYFYDDKAEINRQSNLKPGSAK